jgi:hypothetical protein
MYTISALTAPNASIPGVIAVARGAYRYGTSRPELRGVQLEHVEWAHAPGAGCLPRMSAALSALTKQMELSPPDRAGEAAVRLTIGDNFWSSVRQACARMKIYPDSVVSIRPGTVQPEGYHQDQSVGRLYLLDSLRDRLPILDVSLPGQPPEELPDVVTAHEMRGALRVVQARPRLLDEETMAPGLDRHDVLVLAVAMAVDDLARSVPRSGERINRRFHGGRGRTRSRARR